MARQCVICEKQVATGNNVSHAKNRTKTKFKPNLQKVKIKLNKKTVKAWVCTRCIKSGKAEKVL